MAEDTTASTKKSSPQTNRVVRVFVSSTFRDMIEDRNELMTHAWPELRRFCRERQLDVLCKSPDHVSVKKNPAAPQSKRVLEQIYAQIDNLV